MRFSYFEIEAARRLRQLGLPWSPCFGHYVFDEATLGLQSDPKSFDFQHLEGIPR